MNDLVLTGARLDPNGYLTQPIYLIQPCLYRPHKHDVELFDQGGYDLTALEQRYYLDNQIPFAQHRHRRTARLHWFYQDGAKQSGALINHAMLLQRYGYAGAALEQLERWAQDCPSYYKVSRIRPKWGYDFSIDYVGTDGVVFEILHFEYDQFEYEPVQERLEEHQRLFQSIDWDDAGRSMLAHKDQWYHLPFRAQSDWKCAYFGVIKENYGQVIWQ
jgi:hypothetical protein